MSTSRDFTAGAILHAAQVDDLSQGILALASSTSNSAATSGTTTADILTASAVTLATAARRIKLTYTFWGLDGDTLGDNFEFRFQEGATVLSRKSARISEAAVGSEGDTFVHVIAGPTAASHTYKVTLTRIAGSGVVIVQASATAPMQLLVEDCGSTV